MADAGERTVTKYRLFNADKDYTVLEYVSNEADSVFDNYFSARCGDENIVKIVIWMQDEKQPGNHEIICSLDAFSKQ